MKLEPADYQALESLVSQKTGLKLDKSRHNDIDRTLATMLHQTGLSSLPALLQALSVRATSDPVWRQLIERITIGETYFFRDAAQCGVLQRRVLPDLIAKRRMAGFRHLSLWSAGCATGEEPYTLAILLRELIPDIAEWTFTILGTDINMTSLETARQGIYKARSFRQETRPDVQERWFAAHHNSYELDPAVRKMVDFAPLNLLSEDYPSFETRTMNLDLIICRNVTIYFEEATTRQIIHRFHEALGEDGWLVVGHAEPSLWVYEGFEPRNFPNAVLYQKKTARPVPAPIVRSVVEVPRLPTIAPRQTVEVPAIDAVREAHAAAGREDWEAVQRWLLIAEEDNPGNALVHYLRGLMLIQTNDFEAALSALRRAIYCDSTFALAHYTLGELHEKRGNFDEARRCWLRSQRSVAERQPHDNLASGEDLTVDMFRDLLTYRLSNLPNGG